MVQGRPGGVCVWGMARHAITSHVYCPAPAPVDGTACPASGLPVPCRLPPARSAMGPRADRSRRSGAPSTCPPSTGSTLQPRRPDPIHDPHHRTHHRTPSHHSYPRSPLTTCTMSVTIYLLVCPLVPSTLGQDSKAHQPTHLSDTDLTDSQERTNRPTTTDAQTRPRTWAVGLMTSQREGSRTGTRVRKATGALRALARPVSPDRSKSTTRRPSRKPQATHPLPRKRTQSPNPDSRPGRSAKDSHDSRQAAPTTGPRPDERGHPLVDRAGRHRTCEGTART